MSDSVTFPLSRPPTAVRPAPDAALPWEDWPVVRVADTGDRQSVRHGRCAAQ
jgi:hypothetical protein